MKAVFIITKPPDGNPEYGQKLLDIVDSLRQVGHYVATCRPDDLSRARRFDNSNGYFEKKVALIDESCPEVRDSSRDEWVDVFGTDIITIGITDGGCGPGYVTYKVAGF